MAPHLQSEGSASLVHHSKNTTPYCGAANRGQCHLVFRAQGLNKTLHSGYVLSMDLTAIFGLYMQLAPGELFRLLQQQMGWKKVRNGIYSARLVIWMMINQRLDARGTLATSVGQLVQGRFDPLLSQCKRAREKKIGVCTGGYC